MGRTQAFDTADVVRAARALFWERGYDGSSVPELERVTGLRRSSLYHAFGSKRGLFDTAADSYLDEVVRPRLSILTDGEITASAIVDYLAGLRAALAVGASPASAHGCLLVNAAGSPIAQDAAVGERIAAYRAELQAAFARGIAARRPGASASEVETLAEACTACVVSAFAITRVDNTAAMRAVDTALRLVS